MHTYKSQQPGSIKNSRRTVVFLSMPTSNTTPRMFSSHMTPSLVAHWKAATHESLISFRYCTPLVTSVSRLGPATMQTLSNKPDPHHAESP